MKVLTGDAYSFHQIGRRDNQEDARYPDLDAVAAGQKFFVVCDGVGGSEAGDVASDTVCKSFAKTLAHTDLSRDFTASDFSRSLDNAFNALDRKSSELGQEDIATTLTIAVFHGGGCTLAHIGDSRIYQIRPGAGIVYRSDDHSLVNEMVHSGIISPEEAIGHPQSHVITRCMRPVGDDENRSGATVARIRDIKEGDCFVLCTDGVYSCVDDDELVDIVLQSENMERAAHALAEKCRNSQDNNTAFLIPVKETDAMPAPAAPASGSNTTIISSCNNVITEVASEKEVPHENTIIHFIKKIFK